MLVCLAKSLKLTFLKDDEFYWRDNRNPAFTHEEPEPKANRIITFQGKKREKKIKEKNEINKNHGVMHFLFKLDQNNARSVHLDFWLA